MEGQANTLAGTGTWEMLMVAYPALTASFRSLGSCVDSATGNIYIADSLIIPCQNRLQQRRCINPCRTNTSVSGSVVF